METIIRVEGMMCSHCKARVESVCKGVAGVTDAVVDLQAKNVTISGEADVEQLKKAIIDAGYEVTEQVRFIVLNGWYIKAINPLEVWFMYSICYVRGHIHLYDYQGKFLFSADTEQEAREELREYAKSAA